MNCQTVFLCFRFQILIKTNPIVSKNPYQHLLCIQYSRLAKMTSKIVLMGILTTSVFLICIRFSNSSFSNNSRVPQIRPVGTRNGHGHHSLLEHHVKEIETELLRQKRGITDKSKTILAKTKDKAKTKTNDIISKTKSKAKTKTNDIMTRIKDTATNKTNKIMDKTKDQIKTSTKEIKKEVKNTVIAIVGIVIGVIVLLIVIVSVIYCCFVKNKN